MADFRDIRNRLQTARREISSLDRQLFRAKERLKFIRRRKDNVQRIFTADDNDIVNRFEVLSQQEEEHLQLLGAIKAEQTEFSLSFESVFQEFSACSDPREFIGQLNDLNPFLLFPLRIETRFKNTPLADNEGLLQELWIRVFPDDALIDTFEEDLSESEVESGRIFWANFWKAGGIEQQERAAWRGLVDNFGAGRAGYIIRQFLPLNSSGKPEKEQDQDIILVISSETNIPESEKQSIATFWEAVWKAEGQSSIIQSARETLISALGQENATEVETNLIPFNFEDSPVPPFAREDVDIQTAFIQFPSPEELDMQEFSWSKAPKVDLLPDRFVFMFYQNGEKVLETLGNPIPSPLYVGPDPQAEEQDQVSLEEGNLKMNQELQWMVDFDEAIRVGMGVKIPLTAAQARTGFDRILVLGAKLSADENESQQQIEDLLLHHHFGPPGLSLLPQGRPTNNTEEKGAAFSISEDADDSFETYVKQESSFELTTDWMLKRDGQVLAEMLGINPAILNAVPYANGKDQCEAKAMNVALWPTTLGYFMESMMQPIFSESDIRLTQSFFQQHVRGRGGIPAIRIAEQPYGILPTTAFSRINWFRMRGEGTIDILGRERNHASFYERLYNILNIIQNNWNTQLDQVSFVGKTGPDVDAHQVLLDVLGLHATSVHFYQRMAESFAQFYNRLTLFGNPTFIWQGIQAIILSQVGYNLLSQFGVSLPDNPAEHPDILQKFFYTHQNRLKGGLIDDRPISEEQPIRPYTEDERNYIEWLIDAARSSHDALRKQEGFLDNKRPHALLYLMLQHALDLNYVDAGLSLHISNEVLSPQQAFLAKLEPNFLHVQTVPSSQAVEADSTNELTNTESKWAYLYRTDSRITNEANITIAQYIPTVLNSVLFNSALNQQLKALTHLKDTSTASLERAFIEHLDCCHYRIDAWKQGFLHFQLACIRENVSISDEDVRDIHSQEQQARGNLKASGTYIGAFGWLENIRPENKSMEEVQLSEELQEIFQQAGDLPLMRDTTNQGYIHAPSLNHAVTAAILRNGYLSNATPEDPDLLSINLSSERVRKALGILEGIRNGQSLAALLGYQLERGLHDRHDVEVDFYIYQLRRKFPLRSGRFNNTQPPADVSIEAIEARNVVHGLDLINHIIETRNRTYPFGLNMSEEGITNAIRSAITEEVERIIDLNDAVADIAVAEGVHQVVQGNYDRGSATLHAFSKGEKLPPIPDVVKTPRSGTNLTHRVAIHLEAEIGELPLSVTQPRRIAEPAINQLLNQILPPLNQVMYKLITFPINDPENTTEHTSDLAALGLEPIDVLYVLTDHADQAMTALDDRILYAAIETLALRPDTDIQISYIERIDDHVSVFEIAPLIRSLRALLLQSRHLKASDIKISQEATESDNQQLYLETARIIRIKDELLILSNEIQTSLIDIIQPLVEVEDISVNEPIIIPSLDGWIDDYMNLLNRISLFGFLQPSIGAIYEKKTGLFRQMLTKVKEILDRLQSKAIQYDEKLTEYSTFPAETTDAERIRFLLSAEALISIEPTIPLPTDPSDFLNNLLPPKKTAFDNKVSDIQVAYFSPPPSLASFLQQIRSIIDDGPLSLADVDMTEIDLSDIERGFLVIAEDLLFLSQSLIADLASRITSSETFLASVSEVESSDAQFEAYQNAAQVLLGEDFKVLPEFTLNENHRLEWTNSWNDRAQLLNFQLTEKDNPFVIEDWMHGMARVREKIKHWENIGFLHEAFTGGEVVMEPLQFPYRANDRWLAMEFLTEIEAQQAEEERDFKIDSERLLYTAYYANGGFQPNRRQCGLLIDQWNELIPTVEETTGVCFHYDHPNSEPPQNLLLVVPPDYRGSWQWNDLVDALHETLDMAKQRAIEPDLIDNTAYSRFLPATISSTTRYPITPSLNYSFNNQFFTVINPSADE